MTQLVSRSCRPGGAASLQPVERQATPQRAVTCTCLQSEYAKLFIKWHDFWGGEPSNDDVERIYKRKEGAPTRQVQHPDGGETAMWCTFSEEQIDINAFGAKGKEFIECELLELAHRCERLAAFLFASLLSVCK